MLPDVQGQEVLRLIEHRYRLETELRKEHGDGTVPGGEVHHDRGDDDDGDEVRDVGDRLNYLGILPLSQHTDEDCQDNRTGEGEDKVRDRDPYRVRQSPLEVVVFYEVLKMCKTYEF